MEINKDEGLLKMIAQLLQALDEPAAPLSALTPRMAAEIVSGLAPSVRKTLRGWVSQALCLHQAKGHAAEARFCLVMLNALT